MGSNDLADGSGSHRNTGNGVGERLKGILGALKKPEKVATLDDTRFTMPSSSERTDFDRYYRPPEPARKAFTLEDFSTFSAKQAEMRNAALGGTEGPEARADTHNDEGRIECDTVEYCDFLPPMGPAVKRAPGTRPQTRGTFGISVPEAVFDLDEPVQGLRPSEGMPAEPDVPACATAADAGGTGHSVTPDYVPDFVLVDDGPYTPNFILVGDVADPADSVAVPAAERPDAVPGTASEDAEMPIDLDISVYDDDEYVEMRIDTGRSRPGISFDFLSRSAAPGSRVDFSWGEPEGRLTGPENASRPVQFI